MALRRAQPISLETIRLVDSHQGFPYRFEACQPGVRLEEWALAHEELLEQALAESGALWLRGFGLDEPARLEAFARELYADYAELPRHAETRTYGSTPYPSDQSIQFHNEGAHRAECPSRQWFACLEPAEEGGATLIADGRLVLAGLQRQHQDRLRRLGLRYRRRLEPHFEGGWPAYFGARERADVEHYCREHGLDLAWHGDVLTVETPAPAVVEDAFFSQIFLHHPRFLPDSARAALGPEPPRQVTYGDGSPLEEALLDDLEAAYREHAVALTWERGDVAVLNNLRVAHARAPYRGTRRLAVALGRRVAVRSL